MLFSCLYIKIKTGAAILSESRNCKVYKYDFIFLSSFRNENVFVVIVNFVLSSFFVLCQSFRINYPNLFK